ncbi:MAG: hypothetical protein HKO78_03460 [Acidimicrobiia bacterium]|nr:hypothetical protein [Acidimicrobiia bacterium]
MFLLLGIHRGLALLAAGDFTLLEFHNAIAADSDERAELRDNPTIRPGPPSDDRFRNSN